MTNATTNDQSPGAMRVICNRSIQPATNAVTMRLVKLTSTAGVLVRDGMAPVLPDDS